MYQPRVYRQKNSRVYRGRFRLSGEHRIRDVTLDTPFKHVAEAKLKRLYREAEEEREGLIAPTAIREALRKPLLGHVADFVADLECRGRSEVYIWQTRTRLTRLFTDCGWKTLADVTAHGFVSWRANRTDLSAKTTNSFLAHAKGLLNWLERHANLAHNPLRGVLKADTRGEQSFRRRALSVAEVERLAGQSPRRALAYRVAAYTGLRRTEMSRLLWTDVFLEAEKPYIELRAGTTKNKRGGFIPLIPCLAELLRAAKPRGCLATGRVFRRGIPGVATMRGDLAAAGVPFVDERGHRADFHALRYTFASLLARAGVSELSRIKLARHSDWQQTDRYTDPNALPIFAEMEKLSVLVASPRSHT